MNVDIITNKRIKMAITAKAAKKLRNIFLDTDVTVFLRDMNVVSVDENQQEVKISAMVQGYCIDIDENFYYLGTPDGEITKTVNHDIAQMVEVMYLVNDFLEQDLVGSDEDVH